MLFSDASLDWADEANKGAIWQWEKIYASALL